MLSKITKLSVGDKLNGFKYLRAFGVPEFSLKIHEFKHCNAGAHYYHFDRNDDNKSFSVLFNTTPFSNSGLSHILEHTVLCGSERFPVRDPFFNMLRRSQSNFMNAMTGYDYTLYPFSTYNNADFFNLLSVYSDAVFNPILRETDFMQEGWRLEPKDLESDPNSPLMIKGIVYNEMKGVFSNSSNFFMYSVLNSLLPVTYGFISGGDPKDITSLSWKDLKKYHKKYYSPRNATLLTYGNLDVEKFTEFFDKNYLSKKVDDFQYIPTQVEPHWTEPKEIKIHCTSDPNSAFKDRDSTIAVSYKIANVEDVYLSLKMNLLSCLLTDGENAPLHRELISDTQLGLNWSMKGFDSSSRTTSFHIGLEGVKQADFKTVQQKIDQVLKEYADKPFPKERVDALLHSYEFSMRTDSVKFGLRTLMASSSPLVHKQNLEDFIAIQKFLDRLREEYSGNPMIFSQLIKDHLLNNQHKLVTMMTPDPELPKVQAEQEKKQLESLLKGLKDSDKAEIIKKCQKLAENQNKKEDVSILPCLTMQDIPKETMKEPFELTRRTGIPFQMNNQDTNGILYAKVLFGLENLPLDLVTYLPLFSEILTRIGTKNMSYLDFSMKEDLFSSGVGNSSGISSTILSNGLDDLDIPNMYLYVSSACLDRNLDQFMSLLETVICKDLNWSETNRISQLIGMYAQSAWASNSLAHSGHAVAMKKAYSAMNKTAMLSEAMSGLDHGEKVIQLVNSGPEAMLKTIEKLQRIHKIVFCKDNIRVNLTGPQSLIDTSCGKLAPILDSLPSYNTSSPPIISDGNVANANNYYYSMPYQVHYVSKAVKTCPQFHEDFPSLSVLAKLMSSKYLHSEIREKGGAYGGGCMLRPGSLTYFSYRDPNFIRTLDTFDASLDWAFKERFTEQDLLEAKLSIFNSYDQPVDKKAKGLRYFFSRVTEAMLDKRRQLLFNVTVDDVNQAARMLKESKEVAVCTLGPKESITDSMKRDREWIVKEKL